MVRQRKCISCKRIGSECDCVSEKPRLTVYMTSDDLHDLLCAAAIGFGEIGEYDRMNFIRESFLELTTNFVAPQSIILPQSEED